MSPKNRRIIQSLALLVWSCVLLYFYASGRINKYLASDFRVIAFAGGLGLAVLGLFNLLTAGRHAGCGHDHDGPEDDHHHDGADRYPRAAFLVMVAPVALSTAWTRDAYSISALSRKGLYDSPAGIISSAASLPVTALTLEEIEKSHRKTPDGFLEFDLMEIFFAAGDRDQQSLLDGLKVETQGRWMDEKVRNPDRTRKRLYRLFLTCCAADSRAIPIILEFGGPPPEFPENSWVKVSGTLRFPIENGGIQPLLLVERTHAAEPPQEENFMRN